MRIEFWVDYLCPLTYLTHKNLIEVIKELNLINYELYYRSYQLDEAELKTLFDNQEYKDLLEEHNLKLKNFDTTTIHQVSHLAKRRECAQIFNEQIFEELFVKNKEELSDEIVLRIAESCGMETENIKTVIETKCYTKQIVSNKINAQNRNITYIPHIRVNIKNHLGGYQSKDQIKTFLIEILRKSPKTEYCGEYCDY